MKRLFDFAFCEKEITPAVVFYLVPVGISKADKAAYYRVQRLTTGDNRFLFRPHNSEGSRFLDAVANSVGVTLRRGYIPISRLANFLRTTPPQLLNSDRVRTSCVSRLLFGTSIPRNCAKRIQ